MKCWLFLQPRYMPKPLSSRLAFAVCAIILETSIDGALKWE